MRYLRKEDILTADMNGETVMMDAEQGKYYNLGEVGGSIWTQLETPKTLEELVNALTAEYNVDPEQCRADVQPFLDKMVSIGLVRCEQE